MHANSQLANARIPADLSLLNQHNRKTLHAAFPPRASFSTHVDVMDDEVVEDWRGNRILTVSAACHGRTDLFHTVADSDLVASNSKRFKLPVRLGRQVEIALCQAVDLMRPDLDLDLSPR